MARARRFVRIVAGSPGKFWEVWREGSAVYTRFGKIGMPSGVIASRGQTRPSRHA